MKIISLIIGAMTMLAAGPAVASIIDFEDQPDGVTDSTALVSSGFLFSVGGSSASAVLSTYAGAGACEGGCSGNGSKTLGFYDPNLVTPFEIIMQSNTSEPFNLDGFSFAPLFALSIADGSQVLTVTGRKTDGSIVSDTFQFPNGGALLDISLASSMFGNLESVVFSSTSFWFSLDNIRVSEVPLPAALPLFLAGIGGLSLMRRRTSV